MKVRCAFLIILAVWHMAAEEAEVANASSVLHEKKEHNAIDREGRLRLYQNDNETLAINEKDGRRILINSAGDRVTRRIYDGDGRLSRRETWLTGEGNCTKKEEYLYDGDSKAPLSCLVREKDGGDNQWIQTEVTYDGGLVAEEKMWQIETISDDDGDGKREEKHLLKVVRRQYAEGKLKEVITTKKGEDGKKVVFRDEYDGMNTYHYENGTLRMSVVYENENDYTTTVVFGEGDEMVKAVTVYKDGRKTDSKVIK